MTGVYDTMLIVMELRSNILRVPPVVFPVCVTVIEKFLACGYVLYAGIYDYVLNAVVQANV